MPVDPTTKLALDAAKAAITAGSVAMRRELARRRGSDALLANTSRIDAALDEAVEVLASEPETLPQAIRAGLQHLLSRPQLFKSGAARDWIKTSEAKVSLKAIALAAIRGEDQSALIENALQHFALFDTGDDGVPDGGEVLAEGLDFLMRSITRDLSTADQLVLEKLDGMREELDRKRPVDAAEFVDPAVIDQLRRMRQRRFFRSAKIVDEAQAFGRGLLEGKFQSASAALRSEALAWCARVLAFKEHADPRPFVLIAEELAAGEPDALIVAKAFVAAADDWEAGLKLLDPDRSKLQATAMLQILRFGLGTEAGLARAEQAGIDAAALDGDGRYVLMTSLVELGRWDEAAALSRIVSDDDYSETPALLWITATLLVATTVPLDLRDAILQSIPASPSGFPMGDDSLSLEARRLAKSLMLQAAQRCEALGLTEGPAARRYALWLDLRDPDRHGEAMAQLRGAFAEPHQGLNLLSLALGFGLDADIQATLLNIDKQLARNPDGSPELFEAMLALLLHLSITNAEGAVSVLERYRDTFERVLDPGSLRTIRIKSLAASGRKEEARALLEQDDLKGLPAATRTILDSLANSDGGDASLDALEAAYREDPQTAHLLPLIGRYLKNDAPDRFVELSTKLLSELPSSDLAIDIVRHLVAHGRDADALDLLAIAGDAVLRSTGLIAEAAWINFRQGRFGEAEQLLSTLDARRSDVDDRMLRFQLLVATGRWDDLHLFLEEQWRHRAERSPEELARAASLSAEIGGPRTADFAEAAAAAAPQSPHVLVSAYSAATAAGLEEAIPHSINWIMQAAQLSGEDGPVRSGSLEELLEGKEEWDQRVEDALNFYAAGTLPLDLVGRMLRRSWLDLQLSPLLANPGVADARRRALVPLFSGRATPFANEPISDDAISLDNSAIVTLAAIDALDAVIKAFSKVFVRHDLFVSLFKERGRLRYHQPSQTAFAHRLIALANAKKVLRFTASQIPDAALAADLGPGRADMLAEAASQETGQHIFVHPFPITRAGSLSREPVPLDAYGQHLASCSAVVDALQKLGQVGKREADAAHAYLGMQEERWPDEPIIQKGATLYLSDLAVAYFRHVRLLDRIVDAGLVPIVSTSELEEAQGLIELERLSDQADAVLTRLRQAVARGVQEGRVTFCPAPSCDEEEMSVRAIGSLVGASGLLVTDDRFLNRHERFEDRGETALIMSSVECLSRLVASGRFDRQELNDIRTRLRRAGAAFVPIDATELRELVAAANTTTNEESPLLAETAELKSLRENVRLAQARGWFDPEKDGPWLSSLTGAAAEIIIEQWRDDVLDAVRTARSDWLLQLIDSRNWADSRAKRDLHTLASSGPIIDILKLASHADEPENDARAAFEDWLEQCYLEPLLSGERPLRTALLENLRVFVQAIAKDSTAGVGMDPRLPFRMMIDRFPRFLQVALLEDRQLQEQSGYSLDATLEIGQASFPKNALFEEVADLYGDARKPRTIADQSGRTWHLTTDASKGWALKFRHGKIAYAIRGIAGLHPRPEARVAILDATLQSRGIHPNALQAWRERLQAGQLDGSEIEALDRDTQSFPPFVLQAILDSIEANGIENATLVPREAAYYERLVGKSEAQTLEAFLLDPARSDVNWAADSPLDRAQWVLLRASHAGIVTASDFEALSKDDWQALGSWALQSGDVLAKLCFGEHALPIAHDDPELERVLIEIGRQIGELDPADKSGPLHLLSSLIVFVDGELSLQGTLAHWPPFRRRQAAIAQASLIARVLYGRIDTDAFADRCYNQRGWRFSIQTLIDMRREPRWRPDFVAPEQLKAEFTGRLSSAANGLKEEHLTPALKKAFTAEEGGLRDHLAIPMIFWPGPLEGGINASLREPPSELLAAVEQGLGEEPLTFASLNPIINCQAMFSLPPDIAARAAARVTDAGSRLLGDHPADRAYGYLIGLAMLAASNRLPDLADTIRLLARHLRRRTSAPIAAADEMQLALTACASREDEADWRNAIGEWVLELSACIEPGDEASSLLEWIETMAKIDPVLRTRTGRARANLKLVAQS